MADTLKIDGKVIEVMAIEQIGDNKKQLFVIETKGQYPKKVCFQLWKDKVDTVNTGVELTVYFNAESREYNGKWYTDLKAWKTEVILP